MKLKATDLRIGNLYQTTDEGKHFEVVTPEDLKAWSLGAIYGNPIPLTAEILQKVEGINGRWRWFWIDLIGTTAKIDINPDNGVCWISQPSIGSNVLNTPFVQYVHQLQNLYFALTGQELNINL